VSVFVYWAFTFESSKTVRNSFSPTPTFTPERQATWDSLIPGKSSKNNVVEKLGAPVEESDSEGVTKVLYRSKSPTRNHEAHYINNVLTLLKRVVTLKEETKPSTIEREYGIAPTTLYGPDSNSGINLYAYPEYGIAYLGNPVDNTVMEVWYFPATTEDDFIQSYAKGYFKTPQPQF